MGLQDIVICDGHNFAYRAFFAIRNLSTSKGIPTNAVFGFIRQIKQLKDNLDPSHLVVVFDGGLPARRMDLLETYKAQRPSMPDELRSQMELIKEYLQLAKIASIQIDCEEADDVMATLAAKAIGAGAERALLATSDKDMYQIVSPRILIAAPTGENGLMGPDGVATKTGVKPEQIVDWLALVGDSADNIKGVPGIGPKTAAKLLNRFGDLDRLYANLDDVDSEKLRCSLETGRKTVARNVELMQLDTEVAFEYDWNDMQVQCSDCGSLLNFFEDLEFKKMTRELREPRLL